MNAKKLLALLLAVVMMMSLVACGGGGGKENLVNLFLRVTCKFLLSFSDSFYCGFKFIYAVNHRVFVSHISKILS